MASTLWMGDLDIHDDEATLASLFDSLGLSCTVKQMKDKLTQRKSAYCFITFNNNNDAKDALALNGSRINNSNRRFRLNWATQTNIDSDYSVFVGDLANTVDDIHLLVS
jgi:hypothetical protein